MSFRLSVRNLSELMNCDALEELFGSVGEVKSVRIEIKQIRGKDYRFGYVEMDSEQSALDGIDRFHGRKKHGCEMVVTEDKPHVPVRPVIRPPKSQGINEK
jgi:RNA recognition motif-containing protein